MRGIGMKHFLLWMKSKLPNRHKHLRILSSYVVMLFFITYIVFTVIGQDVLLPTNPLKNSENDNSQVHLSGGYKDLVHAAERQPEEEPESDERDETEEEEVEEESEDEEKQDEAEHDKKNENQETHDNNQQQNTQQQQENITQDDNDDEHDNNKIDEDTSETEKRDNDDENQSQVTGEGDDETNSKDKEIIDDDPKKEHDSNDYFTTTINDGETVTEEEFIFYIEQLDHDYHIENIDVTTNSDRESVEISKLDNKTPTQVKTLLTDKENKIRINITYRHANEESFSVSRSYSVHLEKENIIIQSDLEDGKRVHRENLVFKASAKHGKRDVPVTTKLNSQIVEQGRHDNYSVMLEEGENNLTIEASHKGQHVKQEYTVTFQKAKLNIETNLKNRTVDQPDFSFVARAYDGKQKVDLLIEHNDTIIEENNSGKYTVDLVEGENIFTLTAKKGDVIQNETYKIVYNPDANRDENPDVDEYAPSLEVFDISDGQTLKSSYYTFHVKSTSYKGESLTGGKGEITAKNNGSPIRVNWVDSAQISFTMDVQQGENKIVIEAKDDEGNSTTKTLIVHGDLYEDGETIGDITISVEASTIGLGYIIPPETLDIRQGENGVQVIDRLFTDHGIDYDYTGSSENSFYLEAIYKSNLVVDPKIPSDLAKLLEQDMDRYDPEDYLTDSLGEFDFTNGSGWMYSVNGNYPNVGFADWHFKDGDEVRIRFTLAYGSDIGGGMPGTNYNKEW